jgi:hypothetical protein
MVLLNNMTSPTGVHAMAVDNINQHKSFVQNRRSSLLAAIFLMATSAIGPGFITQTATFTATLVSHSRSVFWLLS